MLTPNSKRSVPVKLPPIEVMAALCKAFNKSFYSMKTWIKNDDDRLTSDKARKVFADWKIDPVTFEPIGETADMVQG